MMSIHQNSCLKEWIALGRQSGQICQARTIILAYRMVERAVIPWIVDVVEGRMTEENAQVFMARVVIEWEQ